MQSRREWFKSSIGIGGLMLTPSILSAEEIKKYNPRPKSSIVKLSSNENPYGPSERVLNAIKTLSMMLVDILMNLYRNFKRH